MKAIIKNTKRKLFENLSFLIIMAIIYNFFSCQVSDGQLVCVGNVYPILPDKVLKTGLISQYFKDEIVASMKNEPKNDDYYYYFGIDGSLPNGIEISTDHRTLIFEGAPLETGIFNFNVNLNIEPYYPKSSVCITYGTSKEYTIVIE